VPIALVNARLSERSLARWHFAPEILHNLFACCDVILAQSTIIAERLRAHGCSGVLYCGDLKQARGTGTSLTESAMADLRIALANRPVGSLWLAASTHDGEEEAALYAHAALRSGAHSELLLVLVPRHPARGRQVAAAAAAKGLEVRLRSAGEMVESSTAVYVCDTLGELPALYALTGVAFVGGSLVPLGGHNLLEAAQAPGGCVILHGPHVDATAGAATTLSTTCPPAATCVQSAEELLAELRKVLKSPALLAARREASAQAARTLEEGLLGRLWKQLQGPLRLPRS